ncbi:MAG: ANTAR domain-containing protein [Alphaproteobacteria bacterium]|nr:ANTAR domain-containing protein [Alphaproteobacteria bacterium]MDE2339715.1 ANTAR domain-containing protein [Alphaproteobacteria bacterium]
MRIAVIDDSATRAGVIVDGLHEAGLPDVRIFTERGGMVQTLEMFAPDVILIDMANPQRDELEEMLAVSRALARPIAMFVDQSDAEAMDAAIDAGVSAYVVDGFAKARIKPVLELAIRRYNAFARLRAELDEAKSALAERKSVDAAKALLMKKRGVSEPEAYALLRKTAMDKGRKLVDIADALLTAERLVGDV